MAQAKLALVGRRETEWSYEERQACAALEHRIRVVAGRLCGRGVLSDRAPGMDDQDPLLVGKDGLPRWFSITPRGLAEATRRLAGTRYEQRGPTSILDAVPDDVRRSAPAWAQREAKELS